MIDNNNKTLSEFFKSDYPGYGAYDNIRKLCSYIDGLKLSQRKVIYTLLKKFSNPMTETKTARLASAVAEATEYLHGEASLAGVLDSMAASYCGSNNFPLITGHGNFGSRFAGPGSAAASRYTYCSISPLTLKLFNANDNALCKSQVFEDTEIEPQFFIPIYPVVLLNGCEGLSSGWRTQIYPRNPKDIIKYIKDTLRKKPSVDPVKFVPYFKGFKGRTEPVLTTRGDDTPVVSYINYGIIKKINSTTLHITEIPITYNYSSYISVLDKLVENNTIVNYDDASDPKTDTFDFTITVKRVFFNSNPDLPDWQQVFKLTKTLNEHINCIDKDNRVREFSDIKELIDAFVEIRLEYYSYRRKYLLAKYNEQLLLNKSRYIWCKGIIDETIKIKNAEKIKIIDQLDNIQGIVKKDDSYNYLVNMSITSITKEKMAELKKIIEEILTEISKINNTTDVEYMMQDLDSLECDLVE